MFHVKQGSSMVILISGASHTGKTCLAKRLMEEKHFPYLSIDHLKMGLIRTGYTELTVHDDDKLTAYLWPIIREIVKTVIENEQDLIIEGCYIPFDWVQEFEPVYLKHIRYLCIVMSEDYIKGHFEDILLHANEIEHRISDECSMEGLIEENSFFLDGCRRQGLQYIFIESDYEAELEEGVRSLLNR